MSDWDIFLERIRKAYRTGFSPNRGDGMNRAKDPEASHIEWEEAVEVLAQMVLNGDPEARKAARLVKFVQNHPRISWWYG